MNTPSQWEQLIRNTNSSIRTGSDGVTLLLETNEGTRRDTPLASCWYTALTHVGLMQIIGKGGEQLLQGQLTCDVGNATSEQSILGAACTPQGRVYSSFRLLRTAEQPDLCFVLRMRNNNLLFTQESLHKYSVFFDAELEDAQEQYIGIGIAGSTAIDYLTNISFPIPQDLAQFCPLEGGFILRVPGPSTRFECWLEASQAQDLWQSLSEHAQLEPTNRWILEEIATGIAEIDKNTRDAFTPHMLNYQNIGAISFAKGCYTGQEIVARTEYRGQAKRGLHRLAIEMSSPLQPGEELRSEHISGPITVVNSAPNHQEGLQEALVVMASSLEERTLLDRAGGQTSVFATELATEL